MGGGRNFSENGEGKAMLYVLDSLKLKYPQGKLVLFDVGANVGGYSKELVKVFGGNGSIYAFEPSFSTYATLIDNTKSYANITCHNLGLSNKTASMTLFSNEEGSGIASVYKRRLDHFNIDMTISHECHFTTADEFCNENNVERIHFLKMDVEGHELSVLEGAKKLLDNHKIDYIQFEFGGCNIDSRTFFQDFWYLLSDRYNIYKIVPRGLFQIKQYTELLEIFTCTNFLAELK